MTERRNVHPGQILVLFALFSTALVGMLGLATDLGVAFAGRRSIQNAADAAAYAGARMVAKAATTSGISARSDVQTLATDNGFSFAPDGTTLESCVYVDDSDQTVGDCNASVPPVATGVKVTVAETHPTFFIRVIPGAPNTVTTRATAIAHVRIPGKIPGDGPFLVCAIATQLADTSGTLDVLTKSNGTWQINPAAVNQNFMVHGPQIQKCKAKSSKYKGLADTFLNKDLTVPPEQWFHYSEGVDAGQLYTDVPGPLGCKVGQPLDNCIAILPIVVDNPEEMSPSDKHLWAVGFAAFFIVQTGSNTHTGRLVGDYIIKGDGKPGWTPDYLGPVLIKLTT
jgi:Flp pilus assembly protein TadG